MLWPLIWTISYGSDEETHAFMQNKQKIIPNYHQLLPLN